MGKVVAALLITFFAIIVTGDMSNQALSRAQDEPVPYEWVQPGDGECCCQCKDGSASVMDIRECRRNQGCGCVKCMPGRDAFRDKPEGSGWVYCPCK